jgi:hypothetical protein
METQTQPKVTFKPLVVENGLPKYKFGRQLRKMALVAGDVVAEVRWTKDKDGHWTTALVRGGKKVWDGGPSPKRDQRDVVLLAAVRDLAAAA